VPVEGLDDHVVVLDQLHELEGPGAYRAEGQALVTLLAGVLRRHHREVDEPVQQRRVGLPQHQIDRVVVHHLHPRHLTHVRAIGRLLVRVEHPLEGEADRVGVEGLAVVEDDPAAQLELERQVVERLPRLGQLRHDAVRGVAPHQGVEDAHAHLGPDGREVHRRVEVLGRPRQGHAELAW